MMQLMREECSLPQSRATSIFLCSFMAVTFRIVKVRQRLWQNLSFGRLAPEPRLIETTVLASRCDY